MSNQNKCKNEEKSNAHEITKKDLWYEEEEKKKKSDRTNYQQFQLLRELIVTTITTNQNYQYLLTKQQLLLYSLFIQLVWYQVFVKSIVHSVILCKSFLSLLFYSSECMSSVSFKSNPEPEPEWLWTADECEILKISICSIKSTTEILTQTDDMNIQTWIQYITSFSASGVSEASYFNDINVIKFLDQFKWLEKDHAVKDNELIKLLSEYCKPSLQEIIKTQDKFKTK